MDRQVAQDDIERVRIKGQVTGVRVHELHPVGHPFEQGITLRSGTAAAAENGYRVKYTTAAALVNELVEAADDKTLSRTIARYGRVDLLCLDELGYLELDRRGAELLSQVFTEREERASIAIASNPG